jgi:hypothetical protein
VYQGSSATPSVTLRLDDWTPSSTRPGGWVLTTRLGLERGLTVSDHDSAGRLLSRRRQDGVLTEPIAAETLRRLWQRNGLRLGGEAGR